MSFRFKKFSVQDDRCGMKVGTDAVLLGAWVATDNAVKILDVGTGCGVIALMLAQRTGTDTLIDAVEVAKQDADQARENVFLSPWPEKITVHQTALQDFNAVHDGYDLIVSNPPYFVNSLLPPLQSRMQARHTQSLTFEALLDNALRLLGKSGRLAVILPYAEGIQFKSLANARGLFVGRVTAFHSREQKPLERFLFEFSRSPQQAVSDKLILYDSSGQKSIAYTRLTADFYLG